MREHVEPERGVDGEGAKAARRVADAGAGDRSHDAAPQPLQQALERRRRGGHDLGMERMAHRQLRYRETRLAQVLGAAFVDNAIHIQHTLSGLHLSGWVARPSFSRAQAMTRDRGIVCAWVS